ncbi:MAG: hypothetical protein A2469_03750 [Candidatus Magasanikbacteria bacterium RIFOXYC2_FULL_40_16]|uniref:Aspartyl/glutamyl-tRNA(Asn/Gln) amidotransferase subunit C n=3 Tax=Candidatus Magasanikiibacteriota TaxID=1752731 RepID=A0A1F6NGM6_9BACT|nr:MAG: hypothetical protein A2224_00685 [Candidatus Magasanikbacteria bacterium RIFOXYA2_FULL_40_20]OGH83067.1 MAG: hypothetical protein A2373_00775 [Candidatus Magasanikbacteria bacterium RIFOXYB1_FULL_40_15]OGH86859.1 MAG: hypothetical protein A2301_04025 [Candidatus Magasanikbacteria bacterium RIFOXYB2_FULL_40_13]OGH87242.1 MAG: hypothetical protein A2206_03130 [Candidatus Magasanikbacteria bacterium RIFOXYA1_FULL_40_8]OGH89931.1 MAG: hypothetical protein A2469_03750 [Candidatus Magasanikba
MSKLSKEKIEQIANLARLELSEEEKKLYAKQLSVIFDYVEVLNEVDTEGVEETCQVTGLEDVLRADEADERDEETKKKLIAQFPDRVGDLLKVKQVFGE